MDGIAARNPSLNAVVTLDEEGALRRAQQADRALARGEVWGPLHGVPVTFKDAFETAGVRTTSGYEGFTDNVPKTDAAIVAHVRRAGAVVLGKTNMPPLAQGTQTTNPIFGRTNNPWNPDLSPGGSSGGSAVAVAAGLSPLDFGSDIGGSIRLPAHLCGVFGLKPTGGRVSGEGHVASAKVVELPPGWEAFSEIPSYGPLARSVADLRLGLSVVIEPDTRALEAPAARPLAERRIAWTDDLGDIPVSRDVRTAIGKLTTSLAEEGAQVERRADAGFSVEEAWEVGTMLVSGYFTLLLSPMRRLMWRAWGRMSPPEGPGRPIMTGMMRGASAVRTSEGVARLFAQREAIIASMERFFGEWDAFLCPAFPRAAYPHSEGAQLSLSDPFKATIDVDGEAVSEYVAALAFNEVFNLSGHPAVVVPAGLSADGLPIGVQVVGRRWDEMALLDLAEQVADITGGYRRPPGY